jgi:ubiquinone/menaquinone biosynthesis C-methylase UbiE
MKIKKEHNYELIYKKFGENLPWCLEKIPLWFKQTIKSKWVKPSKTLDLGCGLGNYANYLTENGFKVTAIDISKKAIYLAKKKYSLKNLKFKVQDIFKLKSLNQKFDFVYEISILHNIHPDKREKYVKQIYSVLNENGKLLVCCFSKEDLLFRGKKELYFPDLDNTVYPLSKNEFKKIFGKYFKIEKLTKVYMGRKNKRKRERFLCLMERK